eukprot:g61754.t1
MNPEHEKHNTQSGEKETKTRRGDDINDRKQENEHTNNFEQYRQRHNPESVIRERYTVSEMFGRQTVTRWIDSTVYEPLDNFFNFIERDFLCPCLPSDVGSSSINGECVLSVLYARAAALEIPLTNNPGLRMAVYGYLVVGICYLLFISILYWVIFSKFMPLTGHPLFDWLKLDRYYCLLVPAQIPVLLLVVLVHWLGFKLFSHG